MNVKEVSLLHNWLLLHLIKLDYYPNGVREIKVFGLTLDNIFFVSPKVSLETFFEKFVISFAHREWNFKRNKKLIKTPHHHSHKHHPMCVPRSF